MKFISIAVMALLSNTSAHKLAHHQKLVQPTGTDMPPPPTNTTTTGPPPNMPPPTPAMMAEDITNMIIKQTDANGDGKIQRKEALDFFDSQVPPNAPDREAILASMNTMFDMADADGNGTVERHELFDSIHKQMSQQPPLPPMPPTPPHPGPPSVQEIVEMALNEVDTNGDRIISKQEALDSVTRHMPPDMPKEDVENMKKTIMAMFNDADADGNGEVDEYELYMQIEKMMNGHPPPPPPNTGGTHPPPTTGPPTTGPPTTGPPHDECKCDATSFCNGDNGPHRGFCEPCSNFSDPTRCENDGLPDFGVGDCLGKCFGTHKK